jgi:hypothetical protein
MWVLQWMEKNQQLFMIPICGYCNGCKKKSTTIYETYMWVLQWILKNQQLFTKPICGYCIFEMALWKL